MLHIYIYIYIYIYDISSLRVKLYCFQRFGLGLAFLLSPNLFLSLSSSTLKMEATEFSGMFVIYGFISLEKNSPQRKPFRNGNRYKQEVQIAGTRLLTNFGEVQFTQLNKASAMCSNNPTSKTESVTQVSSFRKLYTSSQAKYCHCKPNRTRKCALNMR